ncbi:MAG: DUF433 domain-containing protein [Blastocatellia bacterium]
MSALEITINLPDGLAREAEALGLLTSESLVALLRAEIERRSRAKEVEAIRQGADEFERGEGLLARTALEDTRQKRAARRTPYPHIVNVEGVCGGQAIIEGTRIAVWHLVGYYYKVGMSVEDILAEWDYLTPAQVFSALAYYHDHRREIDEVRAQNSYEQWQQEQIEHAAA